MAVGTEIDTKAAVGAVRPRRAVLAMPEYHPPLAGRDALCTMVCTAVAA